MENKNNFMKDWNKWSDEKTKGMDDFKSKKELGGGFRDYAEFLYNEKSKMENKAISKMNKKELYEKCQKQEQEIQKLSLFQEDREDVIKHNKNSFNELLRENEELQEENDTLKEELKKLIKIKLEELNFKLKKIELQKENEKLKEDLEEPIICIDCKKYCDMCLSTKNTNGIGYRCMNC